MAAEIPGGKKPDDRPLGEKIREVVNRGLDDPRRNQVQLDMINQIFLDCANLLPKKMTQELNQLFNMVAMSPRAEQNVTIIEALTAQPDEQSGGYSPIKRFALGYNNLFTDLSIDEIVELPGYIKLHEAARDMDIAIKVTGMFSHEIRGNGEHTPQAMLSIDAMKTYEEGSMENAAQYPTLPEKKLPPTKPPSSNGKTLGL